MRLRVALCNEVLAPMEFAEQCVLAAQLGYDGLEVASFTLAEDLGDLGVAQCATLRRAASDAGVSIVGLHWLLAQPAGLSITAADETVRRTTASAIRRQIDLCAQLGGELLVHGSPAQRRLPAESANSGEAANAGEAASARGRAIDMLYGAAEYADSAGLIYCLEALAPPAANFVNTLDEAAAIVRGCPHHAMRMMLDCAAAGLGEQKSPAELLNHWLPGGLLAHVQLNDPNLRGPGQGELRFAEILAALSRHQYPGWVSVEPFDYFPDARSCAARAIGYVRGLAEAIA